jgi:hypothetical protein
VTELLPVIDADITLLPSAEYLGVEVVHKQELIRPGESARVKMRLAYWPVLGYAGVIPGATFTIREGGTIVGFGTVLSRRDPSNAVEQADAADEVRDGHGPRGPRS